MPESRWITHSVRNPKPSLPTVTWPENPPSKNFAVASAIRPLMRSRKASPMSIFLPETRNGMIDLRAPVPLAYAEIWPGLRRRQMASASKRRMHRGLLLAPALHRGRDAHRLPILGDGAPGDLDSGPAQFFFDRVVREHLARALGLDEPLDAVTDRLGGMGFAAVGGRDRRGEEIFQLENTAIGRHVFVGSHPRNRGFMHGDRVRDGLEVERTQ